MNDTNRTTVKTSIFLSAIFIAGSAFALDADDLIAHSDDLERHREAFVQATTELVENGTCTEAEFIENGGWVRSTSFGSRAVYFMYCGGARVANRLYLDAVTGEIFR
ncbi:MAG: hypothetical protein AAGC92_13820 [Pseudomonadota bacterium]